MMGSACVVEGTLGKDSSAAGTGTQGGSDGTATSTGGAGSETGGIGSTSSGGMSQTGSGTGTTGMTTTTATLGPTGTTIGGDPLCHPEPDDLPCLTCRKSHCCELFADCAPHVPCACLIECTDMGGTLADCLVHCDADESLFAPFHECDFNHCHDVCS